MQYVQKLKEMILPQCSPAEEKVFQKKLRKKKAQDNTITLKEIPEVKAIGKLEEKATSLCDGLNFQILFKPSAACIHLCVKDT